MTIARVLLGREDPKPWEVEDAERAKVATDLRLFGRAIVRNGKHIPLEDVFIEPDATLTKGET